MSEKNLADFIGADNSLLVLYDFDTLEGYDNPSAPKTILKPGEKPLPISYARCPICKVNMAIKADLSNELEKGEDNFFVMVCHDCHCVLEHEERPGWNPIPISSKKSKYQKINMLYFTMCPVCKKREYRYDNPGTAFNDEKGLYFDKCDACRDCLATLG